MDFASNLLALPDVTRAEILVVAPKVFQAVVASLGDYFTAKLTGKLFGSAAGWDSVRKVIPVLRIEGREAYSGLDLGFSYGSVLAARSISSVLRGRSRIALKLV